MAHHRISMYKVPPENKEVSIVDLVHDAIDRVKLLHRIFNLKTSGKMTDEAFRKQILIDAATFTPSLYVYTDVVKQHEQLKDEITHHIVRLAFCKTGDQRTWFVNQECELLRARLSSLDIKSRIAFIHAHGSSYIDVIPDNEWDKRHQLKEDILLVLNENVVSFSPNDYFKIPFYHVPELISKKRVVMRQGYAYLSSMQMIGLVVRKFREFLHNQLLKSESRMAVLEQTEGHRMVPYLDMIRDQRRHFTSMDQLNGSSMRISLETIWLDSDRHFPPCMKHLMRWLKYDHHLKHEGRQQLGLFLKGMGLSMEESLEFWQREFQNRMTLETFNRQYAYNIRHHYGREGRRIEWTPQSCSKIITSTINSAADHHGCPFRNFDATHLHLGKFLLEEMHIQDVNQRNKIIEEASKKHLQIACHLTFQATHAGQNLATVHPNEYARTSMEAKR